MLMIILLMVLLSSSLESSKPREATFNWIPRDKVGGNNQPQSFNERKIELQPLPGKGSRFNKKVLFLL